MIRSMSAALAVALVLAGTIAWEYLDAPAADAPPPSLRPPTEAPGSRPGAPEAHQERMEAQAAATLARPLFSRTRRPPQEAEAGAVPDKPPPRLTGTLVSQAGRQAIFAPATGGKALAAGVGGRVGAFTVAVIAAGEVTVLDPDGGAQVLRPKADPAIRAAAAPAAPAAGAAQAAFPSVLDLLRDSPGEGAKPGPPGAARPGAAR